MFTRIGSHLFNMATIRHVRLLGDNPDQPSRLQVAFTDGQTLVLDKPDEIHSMLESLPHSTKEDIHEA